MSAATRSHRPSLLRLDSNENVVEASQQQQTPAPASAMENRQSTRKRAAPETPEKPSTKRLKTRAAANIVPEDNNQVRTSASTRRSARAKSLELPQEMSSSTKVKSPAKTASSNKSKSRARQSLPTTRNPGRQRSPELLPQTPMSSKTQKKATSNSPQSVRRSSRRKSVAFEDEEPMASEIVSPQQEQAVQSNIGRNTRSGRRLTYAGESTLEYASPDGKAGDPWELSKSSPIKPSNRNNAKRNNAPTLNAEEAAALLLFGGKKGNKTTSKPKSVTIPRKPKEQGTSTETNDLPTNIGRPDGSLSSNTIEEPADDTTDEQDQAQAVAEGKKRGRPRKPRPEGWTPKKKGNKRGRPSKEDVPARQVEAETAVSSERGLLKPAKRTQESIDDEVIAHVEGQQEVTNGERAAEGDDGLNMESRAEDENDDEDDNEDGSADDADEEHEVRQKDPPENTKRTISKSSSKKNKQGQRNLVVSDGHRFRSDDVGNAEREFCEALTKCVKQQKKLQKRFNKFYRETKDDRKELSQSSNAVDAAFRNLINTLDTKGTYEFARALQPQYDLSEINAEDVGLLSGDPFDIYALEFDPNDERVRDLFKEDDERFADLDVMDNIKSLIDKQLEVSEDNATFAKRMVAAAEKPMHMLKRQSFEVSDLIHHELEFPTEYQNIRMEQAEKNRKIIDRRRKRDQSEKRFVSSQPPRDNGKNYAPYSTNGAYYIEEQEEDVEQDEGQDEGQDQGQDEDEDVAMSSNEIEATPFVRVSIPAFGTRRVEQKPSRDVPRRNNKSSSPEVLEDREWTEEEEEALCIGMDEYGLDADNFVMIKQMFGSKPGSILYRRSGSDIQAKAQELKAIVLSIPNGVLPQSWETVPVSSARVNSIVQ